MQGKDKHTSKLLSSDYRLNDKFKMTNHTDERRLQYGQRASLLSLRSRNQCLWVHIQ